MKPYNPIKAEDKIMNEPLTKDEQKFADSFTLDYKKRTRRKINERKAKRSNIK